MTALNVDQGEFTGNAAPTERLVGIDVSIGRVVSFPVRARTKTMDAIVRGFGW